MPRLLPFAPLALLGFVASCASDPAPAPSDASVVDVPTADSTAPVDAAPTDAPSADAGPRCNVLAPRLGDSPEARALAASPGRCGQVAHTWRADPSLGTVQSVATPQNFSVSVLRALLASGGVDLGVELRYDVAVAQLAYVTQDRGRLLDATTLVAMPRNVPPGTEVPAMLFLHGTAGFTDACAPSSDTETRALAAALASLGYMVVAPDYLGLRALGGPTGFPHPYLVGQATAIASLDALRAAMRHAAATDAVACMAPRYVVVGGSQGGHAALWVDRIASAYAPEFDNLGVVATVPPADLVGQVERALMETVPATANTLAFLGTAPWWYGLEGRLGEVLRSPYDRDIPAALAANCSPGDSVRGLTLDQVFQPEFLRVARGLTGIRGVMPWGCLFAENGLTTTTVPRPVPTRASYAVLYVLGSEDTLVDPATERRAFDRLCAAGMQMQFLECAGANHTRATAWALPEILQFTADRIAGVVPAPATLCRRGAAVRCRGTPSGS